MPLAGHSVEFLGKTPNNNNNNNNNNNEFLYRIEKTHQCVTLLSLGSCNLNLNLMMLLFNQ